MFTSSLDVWINILGFVLNVCAILLNKGVKLLLKSVFSTHHTKEIQIDNYHSNDLLSSTTVQGEHTEHAVVKGHWAYLGLKILTEKQFQRDATQHSMIKVWIHKDNHVHLLPPMVCSCVTECNYGKETGKYREGVRGNPWPLFYISQ